MQSAQFQNSQECQRDEGMQIEGNWLLFEQRTSFSASPKDDNERGGEYLG